MKKVISILSIALCALFAQVASADTGKLTLIFVDKDGKKVNVNGTATGNICHNYIDWVCDPSSKKFRGSEVTLNGNVTGGQSTARAKIYGSHIGERKQNVIVRSNGHHIMKVLVKPRSK